MIPFVHYIIMGIALLSLKLLTIRISKISTSRYHQALSEFSKILAKFTKLTFLMHAFGSCTKCVHTFSSKYNFL